MAARFDYPQAQEIRDALARHGVRYLFIGKSGAILLGFSDTTQDADLFVEKAADNNAALARALVEPGFDLTPEEQAEVQRGKGRESLPRLRAFRDYWLRERRRG
jgi:hypothetical protein